MGGRNHKTITIWQARDEPLLRMKMEVSGRQVGPLNNEEDPQKVLKGAKVNQKT